LTISRGVEDNQNSRRTRRAHTNRCKQKHASRVSLCPKTAIKATSKRKSEIQKRKDSAIAASAVLHKARSDASYTNSKRHRRHASRVENLKYSERRSLSKNLELSFLSIDEQGNIIPKTPEAALVAAQTYMYTTRPSPGDPREHMHWAELQGLRMVGNKLTAKEEKAYHNKGTHKPRSPRRHNSPRHRSGSRRSR
jgi:hypothetical protein